MQDINDTIKQLLEHEKERDIYQVLNNEILKYIYQNIPANKINADIYQQKILPLTMENTTGTYDSIQDLLNDKIKDYNDAEATAFFKDYEYQDMIITIEKTIEKINRNNPIDDIEADADDEADLSDVIIINHHTPNIIQYNDNQTYVYNEALLSEVKKYMDNDYELAKMNGDFIYVDTDMISELKGSIEDLKDDEKTNADEIKDKEAELKKLQSKQTAATKQNKQYQHSQYNKIQDKLYFIKPNPASNLTFLVYEANDINYFTEYDESKKTTKILKNQYNKFNQSFKLLYPFDKFIKNLDVYTEPERTSYNVLFKDGYIFNFNELTISSETTEIPSAKSDLKYDGQRLTNQQEKLLDTYFRKMYPSTGVFKQYLLYILCNFNKYHIKQSNFINIDDSAIGKTARISAMLELGFNSNADSNVLKKSELYNVANYNMLIVNEADTDKIDGSILSDFSDSTPKDYTVKNKDSMRVKAKDKPQLTIIGENLPLFERLNKGTERRFLLIPKVANSFRFLVADKIKIDNGIITDPEKIESCKYEELKQFYSFLYNQPMQVIQYYLLKIKEYNIIAEADAIANDMRVTIEDLSKLLTTTEDVFNKFFNAEPIAADEITVTDMEIILIGNQSINRLLNIINRDFIKTDKFKNPAEAKKKLNTWLKEVNEIKNLKDYGRTWITKDNRKEEAFYIYQLTQKAVIEIDKYNRTAKEYDRIIYKSISKKDDTI